MQCRGAAAHWLAGAQSSAPGVFEGKFQTTGAGGKYAQLQSGGNGALHVSALLILSTLSLTWTLECR